MEDVRDVWAEFASEIGGEFSSGESSKGDSKQWNFHTYRESEVITSDFKGWPISLKYFEDTKYVRRGSPTGDYDSPQTVEKVTRITTYYQREDVRKDDFWFNIKKRGVLSKILYFIERNNTSLGYPEIDRNFKISTNDHSIVQGIFRKQKIRQMMLGLPSTTMISTARILMSTSLTLTIKRPVEDIGQLRDLFELFVEILDVLHDMGLVKHPEITHPAPHPRLRVQRPRTKTATGENRRLKLFENWLEYLCFCSGISVMFESKKGGLVQLSFFPDSEIILIEVITNLWEDYSNESLSEHTANQLTKKGFKPPETIDSTNYWQELGKEELRPITKLVEWAFREVFGEGNDYEVKMIDFV